MKNENTNHYSHHIGHRYSLAFLLHRLGRWFKAIFYRANKRQNCPLGKDAAQPSSKRKEVHQQQLDDNIRKLMERKKELLRTTDIIDWLVKEEDAYLIMKYKELFGDQPKSDVKKGLIEWFERFADNERIAIRDLEAEIAVQQLIIDAL